MILGEPAYRSWGRLMMLLAEAEVAAAVMNGNGNLSDRDAATQRYVTAVDDIVAELGALKRAEVLARLGVVLLQEEYRDQGGRPSS